MGLPLFFKHDLGGEFRSAVFDAMLRSLLVIVVPSPPYYPRFNGKNERGNLEARRWIADADKAREPVDVVLEKLRKGTYDQNDQRPRKIFGGAPRRTSSNATSWPPSTGPRYTPTGMPSGRRSSDDLPRWRAS